MAILAAARTYPCIVLIWGCEVDLMLVPSATSCAYAAMTSPASWGDVEVNEMSWNPFALAQATKWLAQEIAVPTLRALTAPRSVARIRASVGAIADDQESCRPAEVLTLGRLRVPPTRC